MSKKLKIILSLIYFLFLSYVVFLLPRRRDRDYFHEINLTPIKYSLRFFNMLSSSNKLEVFNFYLNLFGNIILFIPVSFIIITVFNLRSLVNVIFGALILSIFIETTQYIFHIGFADVDDLILNVTGSIVGFYLYKIPNPFFGQVVEKRTGADRDLA